MLTEELPVSFGHKKWCRWTARLIVLCIAVGCMVNLTEMFGFKVLLVVSLLFIGMVVAKAIIDTRRRRTQIVELRPNHYDQN